MKTKIITINPRIKAFFVKEPDLKLIDMVKGVFYNSRSDFFFLKPIKKRNRSRVYMFEYKSDVFYAKTFISNSIEQKISYIFHKNKAVHSLEMSQKLISANFTVAEPVFALTFQKTWLDRECVYLTKKYEGITFSEFLNTNYPETLKKNAFVSLISTLGLFFKKGFFHYDPSIHNFLIKNLNESFEFAFLDLDSILYKHHLPIKLVFESLSVLNYFMYYSLLERNKLMSYSKEKILFYLDIFLKSYNPKINVMKAFNELTQETEKYFHKHGNKNLNVNDFLFHVHKS